VSTSLVLHNEHVCVGILVARIGVFVHYPCIDWCGI
jgi:hypothetical protein